jgi:hypothetical protein
MTSTAALAPGEIRVHEAQIGGQLVKATMMAVANGMFTRVELRIDGAVVEAHNEQHPADALTHWKRLVLASQAGEQTTTVQLGSVAVAITFDIVAGQPHARVETRTSGGVIDEWTRSYADQTEAVKAWRRACAAIRTHGSAQAIAAEHQRLTFANLAALNNRFTAPVRFAELDAQIVAVTDLMTETELAALVAA